MKLFVTGASGYIGGSVAEKLRAAGHEVLGLVRSEEKARLVKERGIEPIIGTLDDAPILADVAERADGVINAASSDHRGAVEALVAALERSGKPLIHTSGSSIVCDDALGDLENPLSTTRTPILSRFRCDRHAWRLTGMCARRESIKAYAPS